MTNCISLAQPKDLDSIYSLYEDRIKWMNEKGIKQWDVKHYLRVFSKTYFLNMIHQNKMYVMKNSNEICATFVLLESDDLWDDSNHVNAYYVHNLVTSLKYKGVGDECLNYIFDLAQLQIKQSIRLDCATDNIFLNDYYETKGYELVGQCVDGPYVGNKRELKIYK